MAKQSRPIGRMPWARHHYNEGDNGWDKACTECQADALWTIDWEYVHNGKEWRGAVCAKHDPGPLSTPPAQSTGTSPPVHG